MAAVSFGSPGEMRRQLAALVLSGHKTATATLVAEFAADGEPLPRVRDRYDVLDDDGRTVAVMETTRVAVVALRDVTWEFARDEGEGFTSVADWRAQHEAYWNRETVLRLRACTGDPDWALADDTPVFIEWFRLVERAAPAVERDRLFEDLVEHPHVLAICDAFLEQNYLLTASQAINIHSGETPQPFHFDDAFYRIPRPRQAVSLSTIIALDPFTAENGATEIIPQSHTWSDDAIARLLRALGPPAGELQPLHPARAGAARLQRPPAVHGPRERPAGTIHREELHV